jgi:hypothetical protein
MPRGSWPVKKPLLNVPFDKQKYELYLGTDPATKATAGKCNLRVMAKLVRDSLPEYAHRQYEKIKRDEKQKRSKLNCIISGVLAAAEIFRRTGQIEDAIRCESYAVGFRAVLDAVESDFSVKTLGAVEGKVLKLGLLSVARLEEYITSKSGRRPSRVEIAHIVSALLVGFDRCPEGGVHPDLLAKRVKNLRKRNPKFIEAMRRENECDTSGKTLLDRIYGNSSKTHRI